MNYKGIILAGGLGTRLYPVTLGTSKQLLPVYDKPMIHYAVSLMLDFGIKEIMVIASDYKNLELYTKVLDGVDAFIAYTVQPKPAGIANAFHIGEHFIGGDNVCLMLGDNIFYGIDVNSVKDTLEQTTKNLIFGIEVTKPSNYGVMAFGDSYALEKIVEKPTTPPSNYAVPGLYFFDNRVIEKSKQITPSKRGEYEIVDVINQYIDEESMCYKIFKNETIWFDCGNFDDLLEASNFIAAIQKRTGKKIGDIYAKRTKW